MFFGFYLAIKDVPGAGVIYMILGMTSVCCGFAIYAVSSDKIMYPVTRRRKEISILRNVHHARLIEKNIDLGNVIKAEYLLDKYSETKYCNELIVHHLYGAIRGKFYEKINMKINIK
jgi:hypothetical protein